MGSQGNLNLEHRMDVQRKASIRAATAIGRRRHCLFLAHSRRQLLQEDETNRCAMTSVGFGLKSTHRRHRATASDYAISAADDVIARRMPLSRARCGFRKKIERSPPIGHVGLDLALRRAAECDGSAGYGVNFRRDMLAGLVLAGLVTVVTEMM
jgi:hypothetical protein